MRSNRKFYLLDGKIPKPCTSEEWAKWFVRGGRRVADTWLGNIRVSTVFIGLVYGHSGGAPLIFETMIFGGARNGYEEHSGTWEEAEKQHERAVKIAGLAQSGSPENAAQA